MTTTTTAPTRAPDASPYAWYVVAMLIVAYTFSFIDRQILTLMVGPIRETLKISDTQLSLLHGFAFALFYSVMGIPIGRLVDSRKRTTIFSIGVAVWRLRDGLRPQCIPLQSPSRLRVNQTPSERGQMMFVRTQSTAAKSKAGPRASPPEQHHLPNEAAAPIPKFPFRLLTNTP